MDPQESIRWLVVLTDPGCPMCVRFASWLERQPQLIPLELVPAGSGAARQRFPGLDHAKSLRDLTVVADTGAYWQGGASWVMCLWALAEHRELATRLANPRGYAAARAMAYAAANIHQRTTATPLAAHHYVECRDGLCG